MIDPRFDASPSEYDVGDPSWICVLFIPAVCVELMKSDDGGDNTPTEGQFELQFQGCGIRTNSLRGM